MKHISRYSVCICFLLVCMAASEVAGKLRYGKQSDEKLKYPIRERNPFSKNRNGEGSSTFRRLRDDANNETQTNVNEIIENQSTENNTGGITSEINDGIIFDGAETYNNDSSENGSSSEEDPVCPPMKKCYCGPIVFSQKDHTDNGNHYGQYSLQPGQNRGEEREREGQDFQYVSSTEGYMSVN